MTILCVSITSQGEDIARRLPYERVHGEVGETVRGRWGTVDGFVLVASVGIATRIVGPLLEGKRVDPAVVCVDESGRWVVPVVGGHAAGANELAAEVAGLLGATAVITTATDSRRLPAFDMVRGLGFSGDVAGLTRRMLDGETLTVRVDTPWPLPTGLRSVLSPTTGDAPNVIVSDRALVGAAGTVVLHPPSLVAGIGSAAGVSAEEVSTLLDTALARAGLDRRSVALVATIDLKAHEAGIVAVGLPMRTFPAAALAQVAVPNPSAVVEAEVGTPSVAEAAALLASGPGATLVVTKQRSAMATVAIARRAAPMGHLSVVGLGPGLANHRTPAASTAVRNAHVIIGYDLYVDQCHDLLSTSRDLFSSNQEVVRSPIGAEADRCRLALQRAAAGETVALVCSGDAGVYAMASLVLELAPEYGNPPVTVVPGVTAALAAAAVLGAPLGHDHAAISLSDLLTPWTTIERRLQAVAEADLVVTLYNPRSLKRTWQLEKAFEILRAHRPTDTPVGLVTDVGRTTERVILTTLAQANPEDVDMLTCVVIGASSTRTINGRMVTPRGYQP